MSLEGPIGSPPSYLIRSIESMLFLIDARHLKAVEVDEVPKFFQEDTLIGKTRAGLAPYLLRPKAPGFSIPNRGEPLFCTYIALLTGQVEPIANTVLIHILLVPEELVVLLDSEFHHRDVA
jgi:hypothetical protein